LYNIYYGQLSLITVWFLCTYIYAWQ
jgi:hypothetical protein